MYRQNILFATVIVFFLTVAPVFAADEPAPPKVPTQEKVLTLEDANTIAEVRACLSQLMVKASQAQSNTLESYIEYQKTISDNGVAAGERILAIAKNDEEKRSGYHLLIQGLKQRSMYEQFQYKVQLDKDSADLSPAELDEKMILFVPKSSSRLLELLDELEKNEAFQSLVPDERFALFTAKTRQVRKLSKETFEELKKEGFRWATVKLSRPHLSSAFETIIHLAEMLEEEGNVSGIAVDTYKEVFAFINSDECTVSEDEKKNLVKKFEKLQRRTTGVDLNLYGKVLDNTDFDWKALRGKYVFVKFTATWCGPCKAQIPDMLKAYEQFKDKGFEIVSVYIWERDSDPTAAITKFVEAEKLPWTIVVEDLTVKDGKTKQSEEYGISSVPTMLLLDKEGKVIFTSIRANQLEKILKERL